MADVNKKYYINTETGETVEVDKPLTAAIVNVYGRRILGINDDGSYERSGEELIKTIRLDYATTENFKMPGDVLADSVKFVIDYEGYGEHTSESERTVQLTKLFWVPDINQVDFSQRFVSIAVGTFIFYNEDIKCLAYSYGNDGNEAPGTKGTEFPLQKLPENVRAISNP